MDALSWQARDGLARTVTKTVTYRIFMFLITAIVAFAVTGSGTEAVSIGIATNLLKTVTYFSYERAWTHVHWGTTA